MCMGAPKVEAPEPPKEPEYMRNPYERNAESIARAMRSGPGNMRVPTGLRLGFSGRNAASPTSATRGPAGNSVMGRSSGTGLGGARSGVNSGTGGTRRVPRSTVPSNTQTR
jgi:hypothetical protein